MTRRCLKQGRHSVGVKHPYCALLGKQANCQVLVSLTLARQEVRVAIGLRLYLPEEWASDEARRAAAKVPESIGFMTKGDIALAQIDQALADGVRFGVVLADAGYGSSAAFRAGLSARGLLWAVGVLPTQNVYLAEVRLEAPPRAALGRPAKHPRPSVASVAAKDMIAALGSRALRGCKRNQVIARYARIEAFERGAFDGQERGEQGDDTARAAWTQALVERRAHRRAACDHPGAAALLAG